MNDLEKIFKNGLNNFEEEKPSKWLWWRISSSLFLQKFAGKTILIIALLSLIGFYSINSLYFNYSKLNTKISKIYTIESGTTKKIYTSDEIGSNNNDLTSENSKSNSVANQEPKQNTSSLISTPEINTKKQKAKIKKLTLEKSNATNSSAIQIESSFFEKTSHALTNLNSPNQEVNTLNQEKYIYSIEYQQAKEWKYDQLSTIQNPATIPLVFHSKQHSNCIEVYAGPTFNKTNLFASNSTYNDYIQYRYNSENQKITPNIGINYRQNFKNWYIMLGATYHQIKTEADYLLPINVVDSTFNFYSIVRMNYSYIIVGTIVDPNNPNALIPIYETVSNPDTTQYSEVFRDTNLVMTNFHYLQKYSYLEIPLMAGREFYYKKFVFETALGISYSRLIKYETKLPDLSTKNLLSDQEVEEIMVLNTFNGIIGIGAAYRFTENKALFIRPEFKYNLNSMFNKDYPVSQHNAQIRLVMGIRYEL